MELSNVTLIQLEVLAYVALAMALGAVIGIDREMEAKPAGLRTHMLVSGAAALLVSLGEIIVQHSDESVPNSLLQTDPIRIIEAVITGVSFLGAGTIIRGHSRKVSGLTTAASLLLAATIGICVATKRLALAVGVTLLVLITLRGMEYVQQYAGLNQSKKVPDKSTDA